MASIKVKFRPSTVTGHEGTRKPVSAKPRSPRAGLAEETVVKRDGGPVSISCEKYACVKGLTVELPLEGLFEAALAGVSMPGHRQEIHFSVYCQDQHVKIS